MDPIDKLIQHFRESIVLTDQEAHYVGECFHIVTLKKKEILLHTGDVSLHMRFITEGCLRSYYMDEEAREQIIQFGIDGW